MEKVTREKTVKTWRKMESKMSLEQKRRRKRRISINNIMFACHSSLFSVELKRLISLVNLCRIFSSRMRMYDALHEKLFFLTHTRTEGERQTHKHIHLFINHSLLHQIFFRSAISLSNGMHWIGLKNVFAYYFNIVRSERSMNALSCMNAYEFLEFRTNFRLE